MTLRNESLQALPARLETAPFIGLNIAVIVQPIVQIAIVNVIGSPGAVVNVGQFAQNIAGASQWNWLFT